MCFRSIQSVLEGANEEGRKDLVVIPMCFRSIQRHHHPTTTRQGKALRRNPYVFQVNSKVTSWVSAMEPEGSSVVIPMCFRSIQRRTARKRYGGEVFAGRNPYVFQVNSKMLDCELVCDGYITLS